MYGLPNPESRKFYKINDPFHIYIIIYSENKLQKTNIQINPRAFCIHHSK